jgi:ABC-type dipeptide/oligopeptide/nickel transport system permease component
MITAVTFGLMQLVPGGPWSVSHIDGLGSYSFRGVSTAAFQANMEAKYGLDRPVWVQYLHYMEQLTLHLDFGPSLWKLDRTVNDIVFGRCYLRNVLRERLLLTFDAGAYSMTFAEPPGLLDSTALVVKTNGEVVGYVDITGSDRMRAIGRFITTAPVMVSAHLGIASALLALAVGIPLGIISAVKQNTWVDYTAMLLSTLGLSVPNFILGILLILVFALWLEWLPTFGWGESWTQAILPIITLSTGGWPLIARLTRSSMLEVIRADYIRTARAKGLKERIVILQHVLKNSLIPVTTAFGPLVATWMTGSFLVESVFSIGGIGKYFVTAVFARDYPLIMGIVLIYSAALVTLNLAVDVTYGVIDPRIRVQ